MFYGVKVLDGFDYIMAGLHPLVWAAAFLTLSFNV